MGTGKICLFPVFADVSISTQENIPGFTWWMAAYPYVDMGKAE